MGKKPRLWHYAGQNKMLAIGYKMLLNIGESSPVKHWIFYVDCQQFDFYLTNLACMIIVASVRFICHYCSSPGCNSEDIA